MVKSHLKIRVLGDFVAETGLRSSFDTKRAFAQSALWDLIKEHDFGGVLEVKYAGTYKNEFPFSNFKEMKLAADAGTEKVLVDEFQVA